MKKKIANLAGPILFISLALFFNALIIKISMGETHADTITNDMTAQNEQAIVENISANNNYYLNTVGYIIGDNNQYVINESTEDGKKILPIHLTNEQKVLVHNRNIDDTYHVCIVAKIVDDDYNVEFIDAHTDKAEIDSDRVTMHRFLIGGVCMFVLGIYAFAVKENNK